MSLFVRDCYTDPYGLGHINGGCRYDDSSKMFRKGLREVTSVWSWVAKLIEAIAGFGAGAMSSGYSYEPEVPEELRK